LQSAYGAKAFAGDATPQLEDRCLQKKQRSGQKVLSTLRWHPPPPRPKLVSKREPSACKQNDVFCLPGAVHLRINFGFGGRGLSPLGHTLLCKSLFFCKHRSALQVCLTTIRTATFFFQPSLAAQFSRLGTWSRRSLVSSMPCQGLAKPPQTHTAIARLRSSLLRCCTHSGHLSYSPTL